MKRGILSVLLALLPALAAAESPGQQGFASLRRCVMTNDPGYCRSLLTPGSYGIFDRFTAYKLMPCLPTDFTYAGESAAAGHIVVEATMPAGGGRHYILRLVFAPAPQGVLLDIPASFQRGLGDNWQNQVQMGEQVYLLMRQNMGDKLTCDQLNNLIKPR